MNACASIYKSTASVALLVSSGRRASQLLIRRAETLNMPGWKNGETAVMLLLIATMLIHGHSKALSHKFHRNIVPPAPKFQGTFDKSHAHRNIADRVKSWTPTDKQNVWELSGLHEGDIMLSVDQIVPMKNGLVDRVFRWPGGVVPYHINQEDFDEDDVQSIEDAIHEYHEYTCIRFRPYRKTDTDYIVIEGKQSGCWSLVGKRDQGQVVNLQNPGCVQHGVIVHELMHALGFYHQQSAADRDQWITINWDNIKLGKEHNFNKYDNRTVTDYAIGYDYSSVMHYSAYAFSKNGKPTISPKKEKAKIGQRKGLSGKDMLKLESMYKEECRDREAANQNSSDLVSIEWVLRST